MPQTPPIQTHYLVWDFPDGWGGENSDWPPDMLLPNQLSATSDVYHWGPELRKREGQTKEIFVSAGATIVAGFTAEYSTGQKMIFQINDGTFWQASANMTSAVQMTTSSFGQPAVFAMLANIVGIATNGGQMLGTSGNDGVFALGDATTPKAHFLIAYKNRFFANGGTASADTVFWSAIGATTGLPTVMDWTTIGNAGNRVFTQGDGIPLVGLAADRDQWYAMKPTRTFMITGASPTSFVTVDVDREAGMYHRSIANVGRGLIGANEDGLHSIIDGKMEPLIVGRLRNFWRTSANVANISAFQGAWSPIRDHYRIQLQTSALTWMMLTGVLEPAKHVAWYRWNVPARALFTRRLPGSSATRDFYRGGNGDGFVWHMDVGSTDAGVAISGASAETGIHGNPRHRLYIPDQTFMDKKFKRAWIFARTKDVATNISAVWTIHAEDGKITPTVTNQQFSIDPTSNDVKRRTFNLDGFQGWGVSLKIIFDGVSGGGIHKVLCEYDEGRIGTGAP